MLTRFVNRLGDVHAFVRRVLGLPRKPRHYAMVAEPGHLRSTLLDILR